VSLLVFGTLIVYQNYFLDLLSSRSHQGMKEIRLVATSMYFIEKIFRKPLTR
jgi:hypothetical protein